ncbi:hypothetical protein PAMP_021546 [Pampus punctatissimus]
MMRLHLCGRKQLLCLLGAAGAGGERPPRPLAASRGTKQSVEDGSPSPLSPPPVHPADGGPVMLSLADPPAGREEPTDKDQPGAEKQLCFNRGLSRNQSRCCKHIWSRGEMLSSPS